MTTQKTNWVQDITNMHTKFGVNTVVRTFDREKLTKYLKFRLDFIQEELTEGYNAKSADDLVDSLVDIIVVALGTLDVFDVNADTAWNAVHTANMTKEVGIKPSRPNPLGLPDLTKPEGWSSPTHIDNGGLLDKIYAQD